MTSSLVGSEMCIRDRAKLEVKPTMAVARALLQQSGYKGLAGRLARLSKARNVKAHPDVGLVPELWQLPAPLSGDMGDWPVDKHCERIGQQDLQGHEQPNAQE
eukprot:11068388-Prorocentrum_lima.AAC.1